ncbi:MAG TPA: glycosyltransferase family 4 protein [Anaerolineae bacterium]|nr:glycosyltransferase family 4 protein [Anaerolineae bacterium]
MNRVLLICHDMVGPRMAGPAVRFWELARVLGRQFEVTLAIPGGTELGPEGFRLLPYPASSTSASSWEELEREAKGHADVVIVSGHQVLHMPFLHSLDVPLVADLWIPLPVESLAWHAFDERPHRVAAYHDAWRATEAVARCADFVLVASERQRDYWLGVLTAFGRLHPDTHSRDSDVRGLVDLVPVGCPAEPPQPSRAIRGVWPGIGTQDRIILWTSGVWNWFDPLTLLRAMPQVAARHPEARLVFIGVRHPDAARIPEMETARLARELSQGLHLDGRHVFWGGWVPYAERGAYLLDADVGVSLHRTGLEPRYAFRARLLDAIWAGLPMVLTGGDVLGELLERRGLSTTVLPYDVDGVANALVAFLDEEDTRSQRKPAFDSLRAACCWEQAAEPLVRFCQTPRIDAAKADAMALTGSLKDMAAQAAPGDSAAALRDQVARLQEIVRGYEAGRVMRLMRALRLGRRGSSQ